MGLFLFFFCFCSYQSILFCVWESDFLFSGNKLIFFSLEVYQVTPVTGSHIINKPWVLYGPNIQPMKMSDINTNKHETQIRDSSVMIGRCSFDSQYRRPSCYPANLGSFNFRHTNKNHNNNDISWSKKKKRKKWKREDNKHVIIIIIAKSNPTSKGCRRQRIQLWEESDKFNTANQRLSEQARMILKKGWFSELEIQ